jgi:hypothetical protein
VISKEFDNIVDDSEQPPWSGQKTLLGEDPEDGVVKYVNNWLVALEDQECEVAVGGYVADLLHGCDLHDGVMTELQAP